jgi:hypothetical protein
MKMCVSIKSAQSKHITINAFQTRLYIFISYIHCALQNYTSAQKPLTKQKNNLQNRNTFFLFSFCVFCYYMTCCYCRIDFLFVKTLNTIQIIPLTCDILYFLFINWIHFKILKRKKKEFLIKKIQSQQKKMWETRDKTKTKIPIDVHLYQN